MKKKKLYEIECNRYFKNVASFFKYTEKFCKKHGVDLANWMESLEQFAEPINLCNSRYSHSDWDEPQVEICKMQPYDWQLYLQGCYNFIMEFDFWDEKSGHGYLYIIEYGEA